MPPTGLIRRQMPSVFTSFLLICDVVERSARVTGHPRSIVRSLGKLQSKLRSRMLPVPWNFLVNSPTRNVENSFKDWNDTLRQGFLEACLGWRAPPPHKKKEFIQYNQRKFIYISRKGIFHPKDKVIQVS